MRWVALGVALAGCLNGKSHPCTGDGESWVCPEDKACAAAPVYCGTADEVGACDGKMDRDPCSTTLVPDGQCLAMQCTACTNNIAGCRYVGWNAMTSPVTSNLSSVAFSGFGEAYAVGVGGVVARYDTTQWSLDSRFPTTSADLAQVVTTTTTVYIYAISGQVYYLDQGTWKTLPILAMPGKAMWAADSGDVFVVGTAGRVARWDGASWTMTTAGTQTLTAVWGTSASDVYAVGGFAANGVIEHFDGTTWSPVATTGTGIFTAVWGIGSDVYVAGATSIVHGTSPSVSFAPLPAVTIAPTGIWGTSTSDVFVVGAGGVIQHWDGVSWTRMNSPVGDFAAISASGPTEVFAVGATGQIARYTGAAWTELALPSATTLSDTWAAAANDVIAVGNTGQIWHLHAPTWTMDTVGAGSFQAVWGRSPSDALAIGPNVDAHYTGTATWASAPANLVQPLALWGDATSYYAADSRLYVYDGSWTTKLDLQDGATGMWVAPSGRIWLSTGSGVAQVDGTTVTKPVSGAAMASIWGSNESDVFVVGAGVRHYDGTAWSTITVPTMAALTSVWGRAADDVFAVGVGGTVIHYHAGLWTTVKAPFTDDLIKVTGAGSSVYVTSPNGKVYRLVETTP